MSREAPGAPRQEPADAAPPCPGPASSQRLAAAAVAAPRIPPPHAPTTGGLRRLLGPLYFTSVFWYRLHLLGARVLPDWLISAMMPFAVGFIFITLGRIRRSIGANLNVVLGPARGLQRLRRSWRTLSTVSWVLTERYEQFVPAKRFDISVEGLEHWEALAARGSGFVLLTAHVGAWEVGSTVPAMRRELPIHLVREAELDERSQAFVATLLTRLGGQRYRTHFASSDPSLGVELLSALRDGEIVALQGDRPRAGGQTIPVTLFGRSFDLPVGPAALARLSATPLLPVFTLRTGRRRYTIHIHPPIDVARTLSRATDHERALTTYAAHLESTIAAHPHQWFCFREVHASS